MQGRPIARKALVACPATLVSNWRLVSRKPKVSLQSFIDAAVHQSLMHVQEIRKHLGYERVPCMVLLPGGDDKEQVSCLISPHSA